MTDFIYNKEKNAELYDIFDGNNCVQRNDILNDSNQEMMHGHERTANLNQNAF